MVLTAFPSDSKEPRFSLHIDRQRLQQVGEIARDLFPGDVLVSSDEDEPEELDDSQLELLADIADHYLALRHLQPQPSC